MQQKWSLASLLALTLVLVPVGSTRALSQPSAPAARKTESEPTNGRAWFRLGMSLQSPGRFQEAVEAYRKAEAIAHNPTVTYNLAIALARMNGREKALEWLEKAAQAGFDQ